MERPRRESFRLTIELDLLCGLAVLTYVAHGSVLRALGFYVLGVAFLLGPLVLRYRWPTRFGDLAKPRNSSRLSQVRLLVLRMLGMCATAAYAAGLVSVRDAPLVIAAIEALGVLLLCFALPTAIHQVRSHRAQGLSLPEAALAAAQAALPPAIAVVLALEFRLWAGAARLLKGVPATERQAQRFSYGSFERLFLWCLLPISAAEGFALDLALQDTPLRWPSIIAHAVAVPYVLGLVARTKNYPHLIHDGKVVIRRGSELRIDVPIASIAFAATCYRAHDDRSAIAVKDGQLFLSSGAATDIRISLARPLATAWGEVQQIHCSADDPQQMVRALQTALLETQS